MVEYYKTNSIRYSNSNTKEQTVILSRTAICVIIRWIINLLGLSKLIILMQKRASYDGRVSVVLSTKVSVITAEYSITNLHYECIAHLASNCSSK